MPISAIWGLEMPSKAGGRPPKENGDQGTHHVRIYSDLGLMIADLADLLGKSTASICDPILRADVEALWNEHRPQIERMKELRKEQESIREKVKAKPKRR